MTSSDNSATPEQPVHPEPQEIVLGEATLRMRRSPKYYNFMIVGGVLGVIVALALTIGFPDQSEYGTAQVFGFLLLGCVVIGIALGSLVAMLLERIIGRSAKTVIADRLGSQAAPDSPSSDAKSEL